jgi:hypothetical protein
MNIKSIKNVIVLGALVLLVVGSKSAFAFAPYVPWEQSVQPPIYTSVYPTSDFRPATSSNVVHEPTAPAKVQSDNAKITAGSTPYIAQSNTIDNTKKVTTPSNTVSSSPAPADVRELPPVVTTGNDIAALSLQGNGGFMPSSVWQWLFVILLILAIVIIARILGKGPAHHETHTVTAH